ncbi:MAG: ribosome maturation factor RimP [bacterium]
MKKGKIADNVNRMAGPIATEQGLEVVEVSFRKEGGGWILRITIDKPGGVDLDDCTDFSRALGEKLDEADPIPYQYQLEVTSPGLDRPLKNEHDYQRFMEEMVDIHTFAPVGGKKTFTGRLLALSDGQITLELSEGETVAIPLSDIAKANLHPIF